MTENEVDGLSVVIARLGLSLRQLEGVVNEQAQIIQNGVAENEALHTENAALRAELNNDADVVTLDAGRERK